MASENSALVEFKDVDKTFDGETLVVKNLNLEVGQGEFLTMLGPSGSGKTTTLLMLAGSSRSPTETFSSEDDRSRTCPLSQGHRHGLFRTTRSSAMRRGELAFPLEARKLPKDQITRRSNGRSRWCD